MRFGLLFLLVACKAQLGPNPNGQTDAHPIRDGQPPPPIDSPIGTGQDAMLGAWSTPQMIPGADLGNTANAVDDPTLSSNKLELIYALMPSGGTAYNFYVMTRATDTDAWGTPTQITELASATTEISPRLSPDDLTLYFSRGGAINTATRTAIGATWTNIAPLAEVNTGTSERWMSVCNGGYFVLSRAIAGSGTGNDFYDGQLGNGAGTIDGTLNTAYSDVGAQLSPDCTRMYFASTRPAGTSASIFVTTRATVNDPWGAPVPATDFNDPNATQDDPWISNDQRLFVFTRSSTGVPNELYYSTR